MRPDDLPPPSARFGLQKEMDDLNSSAENNSNSGAQGRSQGSDHGTRHVSFETRLGDDDQPAARAPMPPRGRTPRDPALSSGGGSPPSEMPLAFSLPPSRLGSVRDTRSSQGTPIAAAAPAGPTTPPSAAASDGGGSELSLTLNASMRRTRRRHAAAAAATTSGNVLGPAPVPAAAAAAVAAAAAGVQSTSGSGTGAAVAAGTTLPPSRAGILGKEDEGAGGKPGGLGAGGGLTPGVHDGSSTGLSAATAAADGYATAAVAATGAVEGTEETPPLPFHTAPQEPPVCGPLYTKPTPPNVLAITIARSETLRLDPLLTNPVVRVHCLDANTGHYLASLDDPTTGLLDGAKAARILEYAGRPSQMTVGNNSDYPAPSILKVIPPIQTEPFDLLARPETRTMAAWEETLLIDEAAERFVALDSLLIFEVLQPPVSYQRYRKHIRAFDSEDGSHLVAWAFLRPAGPRPDNPDGPRQPLFGRLKLQLYEYKKDISDAVRTSSKAAEASASLAGGGALPYNVGGGGVGTPGVAAAGAAATVAGAGGPPVHLNAASRAYVNWQALMAEGGAAVVPKYPGAVTVVLQAVRRPEPEVVITEPAKNIRPYLPAGYGSGFETSKVPLSAYLGGAGGDGTVLLGQAAEDITKHKLYRPVTEPCKVPNVPLRQLPGGAQGVTCLAFSHGGTFLAVVASEADDRARIVIYSALTGAVKRTIHCAHNGFVYEVAWARDDSAIITASADGTAKVWEFNPAAASAAMAAATAAAEAAAAGCSGGGGQATGISVADAAAAAAAAAPAMNLLATINVGSAAAATSAPPSPPPTPPIGNLNASLNVSKRRGGGAAANANTGILSVAAALSGPRAGSAAALPHPTVLCHACYVYTAQFHPMQKLGSALVATGAYDGTVRLWRRYTGELLAAVKTQSGCINSLCFDKLGTRLYAGDSAGVLQEFSCDASKGVEAVAAAPGGTNLTISAISATPGNSGSVLNATLMSSNARKRLSGTQRSAAGGGGGSGSGSVPINLNSSMLPRSNFNFSASIRQSHGGGGGSRGSGDGGGGGGGNGGDGGDGGNATQGSAAPGMNAEAAAAAPVAAAAANILRVLRNCDEFDGEPLAAVIPHHDGRRLALLTKRSRMLVVETRSLSRAEQFLGLRCREAPLKAAFSPDGRFLISGSEDGRVFIWDADGGPPTPLPHFSLGGDTVYQVAWNPQFHIAAICSFASWAPVLLLAYDSSHPDVALQVGHKTPLELMTRDRKQAERPRPRWDVPDHLTPEYLRIMLNDIRRDARDRGIIGDPNDPNGEHLVVPRSRLVELRAKAEGAAAAAAAAAAATAKARGLAATSADAEALPELPGSRFQLLPPPPLAAEATVSGSVADGGDNAPGKDSLRSGRPRSNVTFADDLPPPAFKEPLTASTSSPSPPLPPAESGLSPSSASPPGPQLQEDQWSHPQPPLQMQKDGNQVLAPGTPPPPSAAAVAAAGVPTRLRHQQQEFARQQILAAQQQKWRYPAAATAATAPQPQVPYTRTLYGQEQQYEWQRDVQAPDPVKYSQLQRALEQELREGPKPYPPQVRELQLQMYGFQQLQQYGENGPMTLHLQKMQMQPPAVMQVQPAMQTQLQHQQQRHQQLQMMVQQQQLQYGSQQVYQLQPQYETSSPEQSSAWYMQQQGIAVQQQQPKPQLQQLQQPQQQVHDKGQRGYGVQQPYYTIGQQLAANDPNSQQRPYGQEQLQPSQQAQLSGYGQLSLQVPMQQQQLLQQYALHPQYGIQQTQYGRHHYLQQQA